MRYTEYWAHHFVNLCGVKLLNVPQNSDIVITNKIDGYTLPAVSTRSANSVDVQLTRIWKVIIDDQ